MLRNTHLSCLVSTRILLLPYTEQTSDQIIYHVSFIFLTKLDSCAKPYNGLEHNKLYDLFSCLLYDRHLPGSIYYTILLPSRESSAQAHVQKVRNETSIAEQLRTNRIIQSFIS